MSEAVYNFYVDWNNDGDYSDAAENISSRVLGLRSPVKFKYGRDQARSLAAIAPGEVELELNNADGLFSPENTSGALYGSLEPGKPILITAVFNAVTYNLFRGYIDGFTMDPDRDSKSVHVTAIDMLSKFGAAKISTEMFPSVQTGGAINACLDAMGWPTAARDIDTGATTIRFFYTTGQNATDVLAKIVDSEGPPAFAFVDSNGNFVFRDRHHRIRLAASTTVQATFSSDATEPAFGKGLTYDIGWRDLVNDVSTTVEERDPMPLGNIYESDETYTITAGGTLVIDVVPQDPFMGAIAPVAGTDFTLRSGTIRTSTLSQTSGGNTQISITASTAAIVETMRVRGYSMPVARTLNFQVQDSASIDIHGLRSSQDADLGYAGRNDAVDIAQIIVGQRAERLPICTINVDNGNDVRLTQVLSRNLSDRVHVSEPDQTYLDDDFFIEYVEHDIQGVGSSHVATFGMEKVPQLAGITPNLFRFDTAGSGFDQGVFAQAGISYTSQVLILDDVTKGQLNVSGLGF